MERGLDGLEVVQVGKKFRESAVVQNDFRQRKRVGVTGLTQKLGQRILLVFDFGLENGNPTLALGDVAVQAFNGDFFRPDVGLGSLDLGLEQIDFALVSGGLLLFGLKDFGLLGNRSFFGLQLGLQFGSLGFHIHRRLGSGGEVSRCAKDAD